MKSLLFFFTSLARFDGHRFGPPLWAALASEWEHWAAFIGIGIVLVELFQWTRRLARRAVPTGAGNASASRSDHRRLHMMFDCSRTLFQADDEDRLLRDICRLVVESGGYRMAWVGLAENDDARSVRPAAQFGFEQGYLESVRVSWGDCERGRGTTGTAVRTGRPCVAQNILTDPRMDPWRAEARRRGYAACVGLPLLHEGRAFGALSVYADRAEAFDSAEIELLMGLAHDLAFGIQSLRTRAERARAERQLSIREAEFVEMVGSLPYGVYRARASARTGVHFDYVSDRWCELTGLDRAAVQADAQLAFGLAHPDDAADFLRGNQAALEKAKPFVWEGRMIVRGNVRWMHIESRPSPLADGGIQWYGVVGDITERVKAEAEHKALQEQVLRAQRIESVGRLAGGIAHDLNNILSPVVLGVTLLRDWVQTPEAVEMLTVMEISAKRGAAIIEQLLAFSRGRDGEIVPVELGAVVREMVAIIRETFPKNVVTQTQCPSDLAMVAGNPTQLHQVLMNLCLNARDAMPTGGTLRIGLENFAVDADFAGRNPGLAPGPHVVLTVRDSGTGIAPDILDKIFDPFFTTKTLGGGTGLGLSTVLGIVKSHGGIIHVASPVGEGAQFRVYLPAVPAVVIPAAGAAAPAPAPVGRGETILVVDDELAVRLVMRKLLEKNHYRVVEAADGREGLAVFRLHRATIAAVITDLLMPVLDGPAFIRELRAIDANVPVIAASGHLDGAEFPPEQRAAVQAVLAKPYAVDALLECLHGVLKAARLRLTATAGRGPPSAEAYGGCGAPSVDG